MAALVACGPADTPTPQSPSDVLLTTRLSTAVLPERETPPSTAQVESEWRREELPEPEAPEQSNSSVPAQDEGVFCAPPRPLWEVYQDRAAALQHVCDLLSAKQKEKAAIRGRAICARESAHASTGDTQEEWRRVLRECEAQESEVSKEIESLTSDKCAREEEEKASLRQLVAARRRLRGSKEHLRLLRLVWGVQRDDREVDTLVDELLDEVVAGDQDVEAEEMAAYLDELLDDLAAEESQDEAVRAPIDSSELEAEGQEKSQEESESESGLDSVPTISPAPTICADEGVAAEDCEGAGVEAERVASCGGEKAEEPRRIPFCERAFMVMYHDLEDAESQQKEQGGLEVKASKNCAKCAESPKPGEAQKPKVNISVSGCTSGLRLGFMETFRRQEQERRAEFEAILEKHYAEEKKAEDAAREAAKRKKAAAVMNKSMEVSKALEGLAAMHSLPSTSATNHTAEFIDKNALLWALVAMLLSAIALYLLA